MFRASWLNDRHALFFLYHEKKWLFLVSDTKISVNGVHAWKAKGFGVLNIQLKEKLNPIWVTVGLSRALSVSSLNKQSFSIWVYLVVFERMRMRGVKVALCFVAFVWYWICGNGLLSPKGVNFEGKVWNFEIFFIHFIMYCKKGAFFL